MTVFATYCAAQKDESERKMPAIDRYHSRRIAAVHQASNALGFGFMILSGKYGLLSPHEPIDYYDHLLLPREVEAHARLAAGQLTEKGITDIIFYSFSVEKDPAVKAYIDCMQLAAAKAGAEFKVLIIAIQD